MINYLLDTDIIVDFLRGHRPAIDFISGLNEINISYITVLEILNGCEDKKSFAKTTKLFDHINVIFSSEKSQKRSLSIFSKFKLSNGIGILDSVISGIVIEEKYVLVTRNIKHFNFIEEVTVFTPY